MGASNKIVVGFLMSVALVQSAAAYDLPAVNLGNTSFFDGALPASNPRLIVVEYLVFYKASHFKDNNGNDLALPKQKIDTFAPVTQFIYTAPNKIFGDTSWGLNLLVPVLARAKVDDGLGNVALASRTGVGDTVLGAFIAPKPVMGPNGPVFSHAFELDIIAPTGTYNRNYAINPGSHFWSVNPFYAATWWATPQWSFSGRFHYLWNGRNSDPNAAFGPGVTSTQAGQAVHINLTTQYQINSVFFIGINGYWLNQFTDTKVNGTAVDGRRERIAALGPGMIFNIAPNFSMYLNTYKEFDARNRTEGGKVVLRFNALF